HASRARTRSSSRPLPAILCGLVALLGSRSSFASQIVAYDVAAGTKGDQGYAGAMGMDFKVARRIYVYELGVFDSDGDGFRGTLAAGLYALTRPKEPLVTLTFTPRAPGVLRGGSRFLPLACPLELPAGFQGSIVASGFSEADRNGNVGTV